MVEIILIFGRAYCFTIGGKADRKINKVSPYLSTFPGQFSKLAWLRALQFEFKLGVIFPLHLQAFLSDMRVKPSLHELCEIARRGGSKENMGRV